MAWGCAQQIGPSGGPKDSTSPKIKESFPQNFSAGFKGNKIKLIFDEFVQLKDLQSKMIVSPPLNDFPQVKIKRKTVEFEFADTLHPNTTYNFNFGDGIIDNNEGNPLDSNLFVFSTGNNIDSLFLNGKIKNAFNLLPEKGVMVMLYDKFSDSLPYLEKPFYFTKSKDDGSFKIPFMKEGKYKLFALKGGNGNFIYDLADEHIGFLETPVWAGDSVEKEVCLFEENAAKQFLKRGYAEHFGKIVFVFNLPAEKAKAVPLSPILNNDWFIEEWSEKKDSLIYWLNGTAAMDSIRVQVSVGNEILDTVEIIIPPKEKPGTRGARGKRFPEKLNLSSPSGSPQSFDLFSPLQLFAENPVKTFDKSKVLFLENKDTILINFEESPSPSRKLTLKNKFKEFTEYNLFVPPGAMEDIFGLKNDTFRLNFKTRKLEDYGNINLKFNFQKNPEKNQCIIQLLDEKESLVKESVFTSETMIVFQNVPVSQYKLKMIFDKNLNSKWDSGNYLKGIQPEKVIYYPAKIDLKKKFDLELEWKID